MKLFEKIIQSPETLAEFLASNKDNHGCEDCGCKDECTGKETCKQEWLNTFNSEV